MEVLCSCVLKATEHVSELKADANDIYLKFSTIMLKFSECHSLYDSTVHNTSTIQKLGVCIPVHVVYSCELFFSFFSFQIGQAIKNFFCLFDKYFSGVGRTLKMHILEDHMLEWATTYQAGCGLMGEQGAESIHAKFNTLKRTYSGVRNPIAQLKSILQEHYLNISPHLSAAVPPPEKKRKKNT